MLARSILLIAGLALRFPCFGQTELGGNQLGHVKLIEGFLPAAESKPLATLIEGFRPNRLGFSSAPTLHRGRKVVMLARTPQPGVRCGHIIVRSAPVGIDSKAMHEVPKGAWTMPGHKGMPACAEDIR